MLFGLWRPASRRTFTAFGAYRFTSLLLIAGLACAGYAHESHEHAPPTSGASTGGRPRLATKSEAYELVAILDGERLTIYLDRAEDNAPVANATISVAIDGESVAAEPGPEGTYVLTSSRFAGPRVELVFDIRAPEVDDLLIGNLLLANDAAPQGKPAATSWYGRAWSALRHGAQDHMALLALALVVGASLGLGLRRWGRVRVSSILLLAIASLAIIATERGARAHEGHD